MIKSLTVLLSDEVSRCGTRFSVSAMEDIIWKKSTTGVPMHLGHDMHRPVGVMKPLGLYFEPKLVRNLGVGLIPETNDEVNQIIDFKKFAYVSHISESIEANNDQLYEKVKDFIQNDYKYMNSGTLAIYNKAIVERIFPDLYDFSKSDKNNLINIEFLESQFEYKYQGIFIHKKLPLCIYSHNFFRRSLSRLNNFHYLFLDELLSHRNNNEIQIKISIDWDLIGYAPDVLQSMEFEYWFGPMYNDDIDNIQPGLTKYYTNEFERRYYGISTTEFYWKNNASLREFELEELRENESPTEVDFFGCRYVHSIYDTTNSSFNHFDGAIRGYDSELYFERLDQKMTDFGRRSQYKKLFRIDGKLPLNSWKSLVTNYMQDNPLIYEYFGIDKPVNEVQTELKNPNSIVHELVPNKMDLEDGIKVLVSYHEKKIRNQDISHSISIYDCMTIDSIDVNVVEDEIINLKKILKQRGKELYIEGGTLFVNCKDEYLNIPCIFHSKENPIDDINLTIDSLKIIFEKMVHKRLNTCVSFSFSWLIEDKEIRISCMGNVQLLLDWLNNLESFPMNRIDLKVWLENLKKYLNENVKGSIDNPSLENICQLDGILYFKRKEVGREFNITPFVDEEAMKYTMEIPNDNVKYKEIIEREIVPTISYINKSSKCSKCKDDYFICEHSKWLDEDCHMIIEKMDGLHFYWTDKPII